MLREDALHPCFCALRRGPFIGHLCQEGHRERGSTGGTKTTTQQVVGKKSNDIFHNNLLSTRRERENITQCLWFSVRHSFVFVVVVRVGGVVIKITEVLDALSATQVFVGFGFEA